jgi:squalene synthase HpnC
MPSASLLDTPELAAGRIDERASGENFPVASILAPRSARPHLRAVYGFARLVDNLGDEAAGDRGALLDELSRELDGEPRTEIMRRLHATIDACDLPLEPFHRLIEANRIDQVRRRYETWDDVKDYCTYSADPVGRLVLGIYGRSDEPTVVAMSDAVCTGLQLVNFIQDPPRDLSLGRVYLPQEDLRRFGVADADLAGPITQPVAELLRHEGDRARALLERGLPLRQVLGGRPGLAVALYVRGGLAALDALARAGWDVFTSRPAPSRLSFAWLTVRELVGR